MVSIVSETLGSANAPAWVQAIGSLLALVVAIYVGDKQAKRSEKLQRSQQNYSDVEFHRGLLAVCNEAAQMLELACDEMAVTSGREYALRRQAPHFTSLANLIWSLLSSGKTRGAATRAALEMHRQMIECRSILEDALARIQSGTYSENLLQNLATRREIVRQLVRQIENDLQV